MVVEWKYQFAKLMPQGVLTLFTVSDASLPYGSGTFIDVTKYVTLKMFNNKG